MEKTAVNINEVVKVYGRGSDAVTALNGVSFDILDNEFFTLLGPSGCGKTTLLRMIAGFEDITRGHILLYGEDISTLAPHERPINTVFQQYALFPHLDVAENVAFGLKRLRKPAGEIKTRTTEMLELIRMGEFAKRKPSELSGGQQQRVALARALAPAPKLLLLDEPLSALDLKLRQAMREELKAIQKKTGITFVFVTHDQEEALTMSDRIAVMSNGEVQQIGAPHDIYAKPVNHFVANFIGEANIMSAKIKSRTKTHAVVAPQASKTAWRIALDSGGKHATGDTVSVMIRPEHISLAVQSGKNRGGLTGTIEELSYLGTDTQYHIAIAGGGKMLARVQNGIRATAQIKPGDKVQLTIPESAIRVLAD